MSTALVPRDQIPQMNLCEMCPSPGFCCKSFQLFSSETKEPPVFWKDSWKEDADKYLKKGNYPFVPNGIAQTYADDNGREYVSLWFKCPHVTDTGRCSIYQNRPSLCREFTPGTNDYLCVFSRLGLSRV